MTEPWGGTDLPSALKDLPGAFWCCGVPCPLLHGSLKGTASTTTSGLETLLGNFGLGILEQPNMVGAPKHKKMLLHQWGAPKCNGMLLTVTDAASCSGVLLAPELFLAPRGAPGPKGCSHPRAARRGAAGQAQGAVDSCQLLSQTLHFPLRRLRPLQENRTAIGPGTAAHPTPHTLQDLPQAVPLLSIPFPPPAL